MSTKLSTKWRAVIDTNVLVSGLMWGGKPGQVIEMWLSGELELLLSPWLLAEILEVVQRLGMSIIQTNRLQSLLEEHSLKVFPVAKAKVCRDPKDNQVLDLCVAGRADYLVTGDKDLLILKEFDGTQIVGVREFLKEAKW